MNRNARHWKLIITFFGVMLSLFVLYTAIFGSLVAMKQRAIVLLFSLVLCFILFPASKKKNSDRLSFLDIGLAVISFIVTAYVIVSFDALITRMGMPNQMDLIMGALAVLLILEATRRTIGWELSLITLVVLLYGLFGNYIPGVFNHRGYSFDRVINQMYLTTEGIFGVPLGVAATFVFLFVLFGAFLDKSGAGKFFIDLAISLAGRSKGGPAKIAIFASGFMGTISGSSIANVVGTGTFTIPLMKRVGYKPHFAGAVEAAASTGGQITPPIMGAAAFIMAELTGLPYMDIAMAAILPALLYYISLYMNVHFEASRTGLEGMAKEDIPNVKQTLLTGGQFILPLVMVVAVLAAGSSPTKAAYVAIFSLIAVSMIRASTRMGIKKIFEACKEGAELSISIITATACAGMIVGTVSLTGLGLKFTDFIISIADGHLFLGLFLSMIASIILGMSLPTTATYIVLSVLTAPALVQLGIPLIAAHMFILYFGVFADITPPVALASYAGAGIANASPMKTGMTTMKIAIIGFIVPYMFVYFPSLLWVGETSDIVIATITAILAVIALAAAIQGYLLRITTKVERLILLLSGACLLTPEHVTDVVGAIALVSIFVWQWKTSKQTTQINIEQAN
ncbi:TRAP transporter permease [Ammoniphilus sp. CFH 90114]|uniref:TRAP transporter permease n=1 Tax=Ammoniphilus sp. CFH 90114 TaxID=2493665 RepID=UPI00100EAE73|nr:TRAP transporter permease [Ammoniphilus sp. CFH 90114]RXT05225.1 TRAP transporter permease [Ammoniphilus sp. CFH 90114]